jgi:hypothetical protein
MIHNVLGRCIYVIPTGSPKEDVLIIRTLQKQQQHRIHSLTYPRVHIRAKRENCSIGNENSAKLSYGALSSKWHFAKEKAADHP